MDSSLPLCASAVNQNLTHLHQVSSFKTPVAGLLRAALGVKLQVGAFMRTLFLAGSICGLAMAVWAERQGVMVRGQAPFRTYGSRTGFGNILFPGTGSAPPLTSPFSITDTTFAQRLGATVSGFPPYTGAPIGAQRGGRGAVAAPVFYPVFVGGYSYPYAYEQQPNVVVVYPAQTAPPVTINQNFSAEPAPARPVIREYGPGSWDNRPQDSGVRVYEAPSRTPAAPTDDRVIFLIALKDSSVYSAVAYWVEGETLHYMTPRAQHNQVSLDLVDRQVSEKLNQGRKVEFRLPPAR